jgi:hypothetical protein
LLTTKLFNPNESSKKLVQPLDTQSLLASSIASPALSGVIAVRTEVFNAMKMAIFTRAKAVSAIPATLANEAAPTREVSELQEKRVKPNHAE